MARRNKNKNIDNNVNIDEQNEPKVELKQNRKKEIVKMAKYNANKIFSIAQDIELYSDRYDKLKSEGFQVIK